MTKKEIIQACFDELNRYFILSRVEFEGYYNYVDYESIEMINGFISEGAYKINFRFEPSSSEVITAGNIINGRQLIMETNSFDLVTIINKGETKLSEQLTH